ncbi:F-box domain protein [Arthroderma uncinatum]|uniref:F-box domain protein n=1 Tax=Arthroderma uncinatum TaxID=74035 RepID=UPI00144ADE61|nr:F-box domain protein [Arthroderma uncinatum]KAF3482847.1 F-box domain protein [Arthroderma uncinatum]
MRDMECTRGSSPPLYSLPYELLITILEVFPSRELLQWTNVSSRFYNIICHILSHRLAAIRQLKGQYTLRLDCHLPSRVASQGRTIGTYLDTRTLPHDPSEHPEELEGLLSLEHVFSIGDLGVLREQYTRFKVMQHFESMFSPDWKVFTIDDQNEGSEGIGGIFGGSKVNNGGFMAGRKNSLGGQNTSSRNSRVAPFRILVDSAEPFSQVCVYAKLLGDSLPDGVIVSKGVVRLWRDWLAQQPVLTSPRHFTDPYEGDSDSDTHSHLADEVDHSLTEEDVKWVDPKMDSGLSLHIGSTQEVTSCGFLRGVSDLTDTIVYYTIEIDEFVIRSSRLLFAMEEAEEIEATGSQQTVVLRAFRPH